MYEKTFIFSQKNIFRHICIYVYTIWDRVITTHQSRNGGRGRITWHWLSGWGRGSTLVEKNSSDVTFVSWNLFSSDFYILSWMRKSHGFIDLRVFFDCRMFIFWCIPIWNIELRPKVKIFYTIFPLNIIQ